jgi:hypothetical protein
VNPVALSLWLGAIFTAAMVAGSLPSAQEAGGRIARDQTEAALDSTLTDTAESE